MDRTDQGYMARALELAATPAHTSPNPRVGAVVVRSGQVISEGAHHGPGTPHAEAGALEGIDARGATCYVSLEPCIHHGLTPPCAPALVEAGIARVVAAVRDPDRRVSGRGLEHLRAAGVEVTEGVLADEATEINAAYLHERTTGRPLVTLKLALSLDGRLAAPDGSARWITGEEARARVHRRRLEVDAVMVGAGTVAADDPSLTARGVDAERQPARVIVDGSGRTAASAKALSSTADTIVATTERSPHDIQTAWKEAGAEVVVLPASGRSVDLGDLIADLGRRGWLEIYCEGGAELATSLLAGDLVDRLELYYGPVVIGGAAPMIGDLGVSTLGEARRWKLVSTERLGSDVALILRRTT